MPKAAWLLIPSSLMAACGGANADAIGKLGWSFDYSDWTDSSASTALRQCDNQPPTPIGPSYPAVATVRVQLFDPEGLAEGLQRDFECSAGEGGKLVDVIGLVRKVYNLNIEALAADGSTLYALEQEGFDLTTFREEVLSLRTTTGELSFFPRFSATTFPDCPAGVVQIGYEVRNNGELLVSASVSNCSGGTAEQIFIRQIPVDPQPGINGGFITNLYDLTLRATNAAGTTLHCGRNGARPVRPGGASTTQDESLNPGDC